MLLKLKNSRCLYIIMLVCSIIALFVTPAIAKLIVDPYGDPTGDISGIKIRNTNVRWPDESGYKPYVEGVRGNIFGQSSRTSGLKTISADINDVNLDIINPTDSTYLLRDDISADEDLYFDMICASSLSVVNSSDKSLDLTNDQKITLTLEMTSFDERINSSRQLMVMISTYFEDIHGYCGNHYYVPAELTKVDIKNKRIYATFTNLARALYNGDKDSIVLGPRSSETAWRIVDIMLGYVQSGTTDLTPDPVLHVSSSNLVSGDDTMGTVINTIPASTEHPELLVSSHGHLILDPNKAVEQVPEFKDGNMIAIPVFFADVAHSSDIAIVTQSVTLNALNQKTFADINILKAKNDGTIGKLTWANDAKDVGDGEYFIAEQRTGKAVAKNDKPEPGRQYVLYMGIKDNGIYDLDPASGSVLDPAIMAVTKTEDSSGSGNSDNSGGGGCSAGLAFAALLGLPFILRKKQ